MKNKKIILVVTVSILSVACISTALSLIDVNKLFVWDWLSISLSIIAVVCSLSVVLTTSLMARRWKIANIYVSSTPSGIELENRIRKCLEGENIASSSSLIPGERLGYSVSKSIHRSNVCFVIISGKISQVQREEIREMQIQKKRVITIVTPEAENLPARLRDLVPIQSTDVLLEQKVAEIVEDLKR